MSIEVQSKTFGYSISYKVVTITQLVQDRAYREHRGQNFRKKWLFVWNIERFL